MLSVLSNSNMFTEGCTGSLVRKRIHWTYIHSRIIKHKSYFMRRIYTHLLSTQFISKMFAAFPTLTTVNGLLDVVPHYFAHEVPRIEGTVRLLVVQLLHSIILHNALFDGIYLLFSTPKTFQSIL